MKNRVEFEKALLDRVVKSLRPDFAAVVCGPEESLTFSADPGQTNRKPDPGIVERVLESKESVAESNERRGCLAVPYLDESDNVQGVMYIEVDAPRRLKKIDLAILERLRDQIEARLRASQRKGSLRESEAGAQKVTEATLDIILRVLKPPRAVVLAMVEGKLKALDARVRGGEKFSAKKSLDFGLLKSLMERGEPTHLADALAPETLELLNLSEVRGDSRAVVCSPLRNSENEVRGLVFLDSTSETGLFDGSELLILERLAQSLESELAWVLNEDGEFLHEPAEDPDGEYRSKFGGDTIDAAELYPISQLLALSDDYSVPEKVSEPEPEPESLSIELNREEESDWTDFESDWPEFEVANSESEAERESDSLEVVTLEREMETTEDIVQAVLPEEDEATFLVQELDAPGVLFEVESSEDEMPSALFEEELPDEDGTPVVPPDEELPQEDETPEALPDEEWPPEDETPDALLDEELPEEDETPDALFDEEFPVEDEVPSALLDEELPEQEEAPVALLLEESSGEDEDPSVLIDEDSLEEDEALGPGFDEEPAEEDAAPLEDDGEPEHLSEEESVEPESVDDDEPEVPALEDLFTLTDEPSFKLEQPAPEPLREFRPEKMRPLSADSAEALFEAAEVPADVDDMSAKIEEAKASLASEPEVLSDLMSSAKPLAPKKALPDDDILRSLLKEEPSEDGSIEESAVEPPADRFDSDERQKPPGKGSPSETSAGKTRVKRGAAEERKPSFVKRAWRFFWPFGRKDGGYLTPVTISGEIFLDGKVSNDAPVEVILFFPDQNMRVTLQLIDEETEYFYSGNFGGEEPPQVSLRVQKKGYFPTKIPRIRLHQSDDGFQAEINPIELLSREI